MFNISQAAIDQVVRDMQTGAADDFVQSFYANRPDWQDKQDATTQQTDNEQATKQEAAKA